MRGSLAGLPTEAPNAVLDADEAFATCRVHERAQLINRTVVPRRELEHCLDAVQWEPAEVREHTLDKLSPLVKRARPTPARRPTQNDAPSRIPSFVLPVAAAP